MIKRVTCLISLQFTHVFIILLQYSLVIIVAITFITSDKPPQDLLQPNIWIKDYIKRNQVIYLGSKKHVYMIIDKLSSYKVHIRIIIWNLWYCNWWSKILLLMTIFLFIYFRFECLRIEIIHFSTKRTSSTFGKHHERNSIITGKFIKDIVS